MYPHQTQAHEFTPYVPNFSYTVCEQHEQKYDNNDIRYMHLYEKKERLRGANHAFHQLWCKTCIIVKLYPKFDTDMKLFTYMPELVSNFLIRLNFWMQVSCSLESPSIWDNDLDLLMKCDMIIQFNTISRVKKSLYKMLAN